MMIAALIVVAAIFLVSTYNYFRPELYGKWTSQDTNTSIIFYDDGTIKVSDVQYTPYFELISPTKMRYVIEDKIFEMYFKIDGRILYWGMDENNLESFRR